MSLRKQMDEAHLDRHKPVRISFYTKHTNDIHVAKCSGSLLNPHLSQLLGAFDQACH